MPVTQRDVAARANVSPMVVSHVLHKRASSVRVSAPTAERVRIAARELGYRCNIYARNFRSQKTEVIGVVHGMGFARPLFSSGPRYFSALMDGIVDGAFRHGYSVTLCPKLLGTEPGDAMSDGRFDGLIWYSTTKSPVNLEMLGNCTSPLVVIHATEREHPKYPTVICDNYQGVGLALDHLVALGHRRIAFACDGDNMDGETIIRSEMFVRHMERLGLPVRDGDLACLGNDETFDVTTLVARGNTAVIAFNDGHAAAIMRAADAAGIRVPEQLSVVGFDSTSYCNELSPRLTSVFQPLSEMGGLAMDLLTQVISDRSIEPSHLVVPCRLDVRDSTMSINARCH
ncbi:MAG: LacI family DNA-binding transcriptional regulator [Fimbriimonadaceae bacterium]